MLGFNGFNKVQKLLWYLSALLFVGFAITAGITKDEKYIGYALLGFAIPFILIGLTSLFTKDKTKMTRV